MEKEAKAIKEFIRKLKGNVFDKVKPMKDSTKAWKELSKKEQPLKNRNYMKKMLSEKHPFGKGLKQGREIGIKKSKA